MSTPEPVTLRRRVALAVNPALRTQSGLSPANKLVMALIGVSILTGVLETEPAVITGNEAVFAAVEALLLTLFAAEYLLRLWAAPEAPGHRSRLAWMLRPAALFDLAVIVTMALPFLGASAAFLRLFRAFRLVQLARLGSYSRALRLLGETLAARRAELVISIVAALSLMLASSTLLYVIEGASQPATFGSIPRAMWWAVATLTTVGYGDAVPLTWLGKVFAAITAFTGIGLIALPTGIIAGAFSEAMMRRRKD